MKITDLLLSQRNLKRKDQIQSMVDYLNNGGILNPITLFRTESGEIQVDDGHHRLMALWLSGRTNLFADEYFLVEKDQYKPSTGKIEMLESIMKNHNGAPC